MALIGNHNSFRERITMGILKNILSFGASGRIDKKLEEFEDMKDELEALHSKMEVQRVEVNAKLEQLINKKKNSIFVLKKIEKISANLKIKDRENLSFKVGKDIETIDLGRIERTITTGEMAINSAKGIASGVGTALGAWALVGQLGVASTGTAISSLSGVALTNATLAWFGGGALAAGGGGMAAGTAVIGGIVAVPILLITGIFSHLSANKKINEIEAKMLEIAGIADNIEGNILIMDLIGMRSGD
jgi:hypothetical protein